VTDKIGFEDLEFMTEQMGVSIRERNIPVSWIYGGGGDPSNRCNVFNCLLCLATQTLKTVHTKRTLDKKTTWARTCLSLTCPFLVTLTKFEDHSMMFPSDTVTHLLFLHFFHTPSSLSITPFILSCISVAWG